MMPASEAQAKTAAARQLLEGDLLADLVTAYSASVSASLALDLPQAAQVRGKCGEVHCSGSTMR